MSMKAIIAGEVSAGCNTVDWERGRTDSEDVADAILSALRSAGWAVVPVEPTEGMVAACRGATADTMTQMSMAWTGGDAMVSISGVFDEAAVWQAMLKAAQDLPPPPEVK